MVIGQLAKGGPSHCSPNFLHMVNTYLINTYFFPSNYMISSENVMAQEWTDWLCLHVLLEGRYWDASTSFSLLRGNLLVTWRWCCDRLEMQMHGCSLHEGISCEKNHRLLGIVMVAEQHSSWKSVNKGYSFLGFDVRKSLSWSGKQGHLVTLSDYILQSFEFIFRKYLYLV